jgi:chromosome segregation ATPase
MLLAGSCTRYAAPMSDELEPGSLRARGEEALGDLAQALLENPVFNGALTTALGAGERAVHAQRSAMGALNIASGADLERLGRRLRSLSDRLEAIEDRLDEIADEVAALRARDEAAHEGIAPDQTRLAVAGSDEQG